MVAEPDVAALTSRAGARCSSMPFLSIRDRVRLFALSALALLISFLSQLVLAAILMALPLGKFVMLLITTSVVQDLVVLLWAALAGTFFLFGTGRRAHMGRARIAALIAGVVTPWALLGLGQLEGHLWPSLRHTNGPLDRPLMTLPLLVCALLTPWLVGRLARRAPLGHMRLP